MLRHSARSPSITSQESYSAVMITDLIADVPVETPDISKPTKEATNLAYDGQLDGETRRPTLDNLTQKANGAGISKGVLLNAVQFGSDPKSKGDEKPIQLSGTLPVPTLTQQASEAKGFKDMSLSRKIAFGFSFLPSVLFVLCFAVILPCKVIPPCIEEVWVTEFNDTEATSKLEIPENIVFTVLKHGESALFHLKKTDGTYSELSLDANSNYLKCGKIMNNETIDCIIIDDNGQAHSFNDSHSWKMWDPISEEDKYVSNPVILSGCQNGMEDVALAVSSTKFKVLYSGNKVSVFTFSDCDSVPTSLIPWTVNGSSNIVFICEKNGEERLVSVPQKIWCVYSQDPKEKPIVLKSGPLGSIKKSILQPLNDGLVFWSGDEAYMIQQDGNYLWKASNLSHHEENRFVLYGNFHGENKQVALISSNLLFGLKVTLLDPSDGSFVKSVSHSHSEATEMIQVKGEKKDYVLMLLKKINKDIVTAALTKINDISTTIVSLVSSEDVNRTMQHPVSEELALLDIDSSIDSIDSIKDVTDLKNGIYKRSIIAVPDKGVLSIYILSISVNSQTKFTEVRNINVANWDKSTKSKCTS